MDFQKELKRVFPDLSKEIDLLSKYGAINDQSAKVAIVKKEMEVIEWRKEDKERLLADRLCVSVRTIKRYKSE